LVYEIFKDDPILDDENGIKELRIEYFVISIYLLIRHLAKYYVFDKSERQIVRQFVLQFHERWKAGRETDTDILIFADNRQQSKAETEIRDRIIRQSFFEYAHEQGHQILTKDDRRAFNEAEKISIYRRDNSLCQACLSEGKPEREAVVTWSDYEADHVVPHSVGGKTAVWNGQVLCRHHNRSKGKLGTATETAMLQPESLFPR
jgi:hypothetical protein